MSHKRRMVNNIYNNPFRLLNRYLVSVPDDVLRYFLKRNTVLLSGQIRKWIKVVQIASRCKIIYFVLTIVIKDLSLGSWLFLVYVCHNRFT